MEKQKEEKLKAKELKEKELKAKKAKEEKGKEEKAKEEKKVVTKYDRKMQKRKEEEKRDARNRKITKISCIVIAAVLIVGIISVLAINLDRIYREYIKIDNKSVNQIEFDFYYSLTKGNILNQSLVGEMTYLNYFESYLGYDSSKSDRSQKYDESKGYTWYDYFASATVNTIKEYKALLNMADENGYEHTDADSDYEEFYKDVKESADKAEVSQGKYIRDVFGSHATKGNIEKYLREYLKATAYERHVYDENKASDDTIKEYYEEHKDDYDMVDYRSVYIKAEEKDDEESLADAKKRAEDLVKIAVSEAALVDNCADYVAEADKETYGEDKASLMSDVYKSSLSTEESDWLFDSERKKDDVTVIEDKDNSQYQVLYFLSRDYDYDNNEVIRNTLYAEKYEELLKPYIDAIEVDNKYNRIKMLGD